MQMLVSVSLLSELLAKAAEQLSLFGARPPAGPVEEVAVRGHTRAGAGGTVAIVAPHLRTVHRAQGEPEPTPSEPLRNAIDKAFSGWVPSVEGDDQILTSPTGSVKVIIRWQPSPDGAPSAADLYEAHVLLRRDASDGGGWGEGTIVYGTVVETGPLLQAAREAHSFEAGMVARAARREARQAVKEGPPPAAVATATDESTLEDTLEYALKKGWVSLRHGLPVPGWELNGVLETRTLKTGKLTGVQDRSQDATSWIQEHRDLLTSQLEDFLSLPEQPSVGQVEDALMRSDRDRTYAIDPKSLATLAIVAADGSWYTLQTPRRDAQGIARYTVRHWSTATRGLTFAEVGEDAGALRYAIGQAGGNGAYPYRLAVMASLTQVSVGSGSYWLTGEFALSKPRKVPADQIFEKYRIAASGAEPKRAFREALRAEGWGETEGDLYEYWVSPSQGWRVQVRAKTLHLQEYSRVQGWVDRGSLGNLTTVAADPARVVHELVERERRWPRPKEPEIKPKVAEARLKAALEQAGSSTVVDKWEIAAFRYAYQAGKETTDLEQAIPAPEDFNYHREAWELGVKAARADRSARVATSPSAGGAAGSAAPAGVVVQHTVEDGTVVRGETRPIKETLKELGFRWYGPKQLWYIPRSRGQPEPSTNLDEIRKALVAAQQEG